MSQDPQGSADFAENFHIIQPHRDPESNWAIDIAKNLEDYLLKIYSGDITGKDEGIPAVNFAEAALMVQGSVQVYSRKVEYLHSLVLHALETIKQQRQPVQLENSSGQPEEGGKQINFDEFDPSCSYDDIEVDPNSTLDESATTSDAPLYNCVRPPPELAFLEGGLSDATGDSGELGSYLLAKTTLYRDFLLLDPSDAAAVDAYYQELDNNSNNEQNGGSGDSSLPSKGCKGFQSPTRQSGGSARRVSVGMSHDADLNQSPPLDHGFEIRNHDKEFHSPACKIPENNTNEFSTDDEFPGFNDLDDADDDDDNDPWKPLNPHEPGNLKVQPFRKLKVKAHGRDAVKPKKVPTDITNEFPLAPLHGFIEPSLNYIWEAQQHAKEKQNESQSPTLYEKLRESLVLGGVGNFDAYSDLGDDNEDNGYDSGDEEFKAPNFDMPESTSINVSILPMMHDDGSAYFNIDETCGNGNSTSEENLEDLCRSHLDSLLANFGGSKKQTGMAARVSSWKQKIEKKLEEQEARPAFDIHEYGEKVMDKVSLATDSENGMNFADLVSGQDKADVARSFSALLQLVNNGNVDLQKFERDEDDEPVCHSAVNPFYVRPLRHPKRRQDDPQQEPEKKAKAPMDAGEMKDGKSKPRKENREPASSSGSGSPSNSMSAEMTTEDDEDARYTTEKKGKRKSRFAEPEPDDNADK